jgi:predicted nucleotide-binding protein (sugar kinase/HSP70/actin superfamily)
MPKPDASIFEVECPCCGSTLKINAAVKAVVDHKEKPRAKTIEDFGEGIAKLKNAASEREAAFQKSFESMKSSKDVLAAKFDELLKKAKSDDPTKPPPKPLGFD